MPESVDSLVLDLLQWMGPTPRPYAEVLEAWRTSCPRLPVWEEAVERGYLRQGADAMVVATPAGIAFLAAHGRRAA